MEWVSIFSLGSGCRHSRGHGLAESDFILCFRQPVTFARLSSVVPMTSQVIR